MQFVKSGLKLLEELPVLRDGIFDYFSLIFEVAIGNHIKNEVNLQFFKINKIMNFHPTENATITSSE